MDIVKIDNETLEETREVKTKFYKEDLITELRSMLDEKKNLEKEIFRIQNLLKKFEKKDVKI